MPMLGGNVPSWAPLISAWFKCIVGLWTQLDPEAAKKAARTKARPRREDETREDEIIGSKRSSPCGVATVNQRRSRGGGPRVFCLADSSPLDDTQRSNDEQGRTPRIDRFHCRVQRRQPGLGPATGGFASRGRNECRRRRRGPPLARARRDTAV